MSSLAHWWAAVVLLCGAISVIPAYSQTSPIAGEAAYVADFLSNVSGGIDEGSAYLQNIDITFDVDLAQLPGMPNGALFAYILWNDDTSFSDSYPGDAQVVSNIDAQEALRLYEFWYQHRFSESINVRVGLYDLNAEFDSIKTAGLFLNSSHGIGADYAQTGQNGPSIFPVTSFAARLHWRPTQASLIRYALLDAVPGDPNDPSATVIQFNSGEGVLHALEFNHTLQQGVRLGLGGFLYSEQFDKLNDTDALGNPVRDDGNGGVYAFADGTVYSDTSSGRSITAFVRYGVANDELNPFESYLGAGAVLKGFVAGRPYDQFGVALASAKTGSDFRVVAGAEARETTIELTYSAQINDWLRLQPDIQYVMNPGADPALGNALVIGIRFELLRGFTFN